MSVSRLYCFPHAGGSSISFMPWKKRIDRRIELYPVDIPVTLGPKESLPLSSISTVVEKLSDSLSNHDGIQFSFFGHSLGGLIAFELARSLKKRGLMQPSNIIISGCESPRKHMSSGSVHLLDDHDLIEFIKSFNGITDEIINDKRIMHMLLPKIRADFSLAQSYLYMPSDKIDSDLVILSGREDVRSGDDFLLEWQLETSGKCDFNYFRGDHFFINENLSDIIKLINKKLIN